MTTDTKSELPGPDDIDMIKFLVASTLLALIIIFALYVKANPVPDPQGPPLPTTEEREKMCRDAGGQPLVQILPDLHKTHRIWQACLPPAPTTGGKP